MVAADHNRCFQFALGHQIVQCQPEFVAFAVSQPTDPRRQALEFHLLLRHLDPALQVLIFREHFENQLVCPGDVRCFAGKRRPAEGAFAFAKERANISGYETMKSVARLTACPLTEWREDVSMIECDS